MPDPELQGTEDLDGATEFNEPVRIFDMSRENVMRALLVWLMARGEFDEAALAEAEGMGEARVILHKNGARIGMPERFCNPSEPQEGDNPEEETET